MTSGQAGLVLLARLAVGADDGTTTYTVTIRDQALGVVARPEIARDPTVQYPVRGETVMSTLHDMMRGQPWERVAPRADVVRAQWRDEHYDELRREYAGKHVAIGPHGVVDSDTDPLALMERVGDLEDVGLSFIPSEDAPPIH